jgi:hypothetical protein
MPYWLTNPEHGVMPVYDMGEVERNKVHGWMLLNEGESPLRHIGPPPEAEPIKLLASNEPPLLPLKRKPGRPPKVK